MILLILVTPLMADSVRLLPQAWVTGTEIHLRDVAELEGPEAQRVGGLVVGRFSDQGDRWTVRMADLGRLFEEQGVNSARVSLRGFLACEVHRTEPQAEPPKPAMIDTPIDDQPGEAMANPIQIVEVNHPTTLRDLLVEYLERLAGTDYGSLQISFSGVDAQNLAQIVGPETFIESQGSPGLGRILLAVRSSAGQGPERPLRITADVARKIEAVVIRFGVERGQTITAQDVELREVLIDREIGRPLTDLQQVIGQIAANTMRPGTVVYEKHLRSPLMVQRGQLITVRAVTGGLVIKTIARATEDAGINQIIQVRHDLTRQEYPVRVSGFREAMLMSDAMRGELGEYQEARR